jgi:hypothetical protein
MSEKVLSIDLQKIIDFVTEIGIIIIEKKLDSTTFLPGLKLGSNCIYIDFDQLLYPGDILHEAGHLAVATSEIRNQIDSNTLQNWPTDGEEIAAILWSFAAAKHLNLPLEIVFHPNGYKNQSEWLIQSFTNKNYIGLPLLEWMELTLSEEKAITQNKEAFPIMQKWMRD